MRLVLFDLTVATAFILVTPETGAWIWLKGAYGLWLTIKLVKAGMWWEEAWPWI